MTQPVLQQTFQNEFVNAGVVIAQLTHQFGQLIAIQIAFAERGDLFPGYQGDFIAGTSSRCSIRTA
jgi:hypothetical protein